MAFNHCVYCKDWRGDMLRYSTRRCVHPKCWLDRGRTLAELPWHQIEQMPFRLLKERGLLEEARRLVDAKNQPRSARQKRIDAIFEARTVMP